MTAATWGGKRAAARKAARAKRPDQIQRLLAYFTGEMARRRQEEDEVLARADVIRARRALGAPHAQ